VVGALLPIVVTIDMKIGVVVAGVVALAAQTVYVGGLLVEVD